MPNPKKNTKKNKSKKNTGRKNSRRNPVGHPNIPPRLPRLHRSNGPPPLPPLPRSNGPPPLPRSNSPHLHTPGLFGTPAGSGNPSAGVSWASGVSPAVSSLFRVEPLRRVPAISGGRAVSEGGAVSGGGAGVNWTRGVTPQASELMRVSGPSSAVMRARVGMPGASANQAHINRVRHVLGLPPVSAGPVQVSARPMTAENLEEFYGTEFAEATPIGPRAELSAVMEGYADAYRRELNNLPEATALESHRVSRPRVDLGSIYDNGQDAMRTGAIRQINKNGSRVLVGETNPMLSTRSTIDMLDEVRAIMGAEEVTQTDLARVDQLLRMARIRNEQLAQEVRSERAQVQAEGIREEIAYLFHRLRDRVQSLSQRASSTLGNLWHRATRRSPNRGP